MKNLKIKFINVALFLMGIVVFVSCEKEQELLQNTTSSNIRTFSSVDEYTAELNKVANMSYEHLCDYENEKGYYSFGRKCEEVYLLANPENFNSKEEFITFVENNSDYIELVTDSNNETSLEVKSRLNGDRYLVGSDGLYRINDCIYKLIGNGTCCTSVENIDKIKNVTAENYQNYLNDKRFSFSSSINSNKKWGSETDNKTSTSGNNRVRIEYLFDCTGYLLESGDPDYYPYSYMRLNCVARSQNKVLWIWFNCQRTMSMGVDAKLVAKYQDQWRGYLINKAFYNSSPSYKIENYETILMTDVNTGDLTTAPYQAHNLERMYFWGDNPDVAPAVFNIE